MFTDPSPNNANLNPLNGYVDRPQFSSEPGSYNSSIILEISCPNPNTTIYYTLMGIHQINLQISILNPLS